MMEEEIKQKRKSQEDKEITLVRILGKDIRGDMELLPGLTNIQGISWSFANAICAVLRLDSRGKIQNLGKKELDSLEVFAKDPKIPGFLKNRQKDFDDGEDKHIVGADLKIRKEFDIKRLRKIRSYKGGRHAFNLPVRGQRTKANFRKNRKKSGVTGGKKK